MQASMVQVDKPFRLQVDWGPCSHWMQCFLKKPQERETSNPARKAAVFPSRARRQGSCLPSSVKRMQIDDPRLEEDSEDGKLKADTA